MNGVLRLQFCTIRLYWAGTTWVNVMNFAMNHANIFSNFIIIFYTLKCLVSLTTF